MAEGLSRSLVHQHGTHCPTTLKTAAWLLSCLNDHYRHFVFKVLAHRIRSRCLHVSAQYQFTFTFSFTLHYANNGCVLQRLIRLVFVLIGLFKSIKRWEQFLNYNLYKKKSITCDYIPIFDQSLWPVVTIYSIKLLKLYGMCMYGMECIYGMYVWHGMYGCNELMKWMNGMNVWNGMYVWNVCMEWNCMECDSIQDRVVCSLV